LGVTSLAQAQQVSARFLRDNAWPLVRAEEKLITFSKQGERGEFQGIEIRCRGWFHTLGWRTWFNQTGAAMTSDAALGEIFAACGQKLGGLYQEAANGVTINAFYPISGRWLDCVQRVSEAWTGKFEAYAGVGDQRPTVESL